MGDADLFAEAALWRFGLRCWPAVAAADYQRAADLGSDYAAEQLAQLHAGGPYGLQPGMSDGSQLPACNPQDVAGAYPISVRSPVTISMQPGTEATGVTSAGSSNAPDALTDDVRADVVAAVNRANSAWSAATQSLDATALNGNVANQELTTDLTELDQLRRQGHRRQNFNTAFTVDDVSLQEPGRAIVHTHETWYAEIYNAADGQLLQRTPPQTYSETYTVEYLNGGWIVTENDLGRGA
jgi:hypothetical protein